jgi:secretion/DNA translocation related TadE-like protein
VRVKRDERGSGSVMAVSLVAAILFAASALGAVAGAAQARWRAQTAADLAALAAAQALIDGFDQAAACSVAGDVARANGASLEDCAPQAAGRVAVTCQTPPVGLPGMARARAVAGPP